MQKTCQNTRLHYHTSTQRALRMAANILCPFCQHRTGAFMNASEYYGLCINIPSKRWHSSAPIVSWSRIPKNKTKKTTKYISRTEHKTPPMTPMSVGVDVKPDTKQAAWPNVAMGGRYPENRSRSRSLIDCFSNLCKYLQNVPISEDSWAAE